MNKSNNSPPRKKEKGKTTPKRKATEVEIINAFDRVVRRDGLRNVGVNTVIKEAGIGKGLLYTYFGGLPGLVRAWGQSSDIWPSKEELLGTDMPGIEANQDAISLIRTVISNHARSLREHPLRVELLADEMMSPTPISEALSDVRAQMGKEHQAIFSKMEAMQDYDNRSLLMVLMAAASFLSMRAASISDTASERYMGELIGTDEGWNNIMARFDRIIELYAQAKSEDLNKP